MLFRSNTDATTWSGLTTLSKVEASGEALNDFMLNTGNYQPINTADGLFFMLPQNFGQNSINVARMVIYMEETSKAQSDPTRNWVLSQINNSSGTVLNLQPLGNFSSRLPINLFLSL